MMMRLLKILMGTLLAVTMTASVALADITAYKKTARTGGGANALDGIDGNTLVDGSFAEVYDSGVSVVWKYEMDATCSDEDRDADFYTFMLTVAKALGPTPAAWRIQDTVTDSEWISFCRFNDRMPQGIHRLPDYSQIDISLLEVL
ncbi:MAG: hypothetical protein ABIJ57_00440 [Pseudomonadota bacterium]